jgi:hypothetical protein
MVCLEAKEGNYPKRVLPLRNLLLIVIVEAINSSNISNFDFSKF